MATLDSLPPLPDSPQSTQTLDLGFDEDLSLPPLPDSPKSSQAELDSVDNSEHHMDLDKGVPLCVLALKGPELTRKQMKATRWMLMSKVGNIPTISV